MENKEIPEKVGFQIRAIEILEFSLNNPQKPIPDIFTYHTNISIEHRIIEENKIIMVLPRSEIISEDKETILANIKVSFVFEFSSFESFSTKKPGEFRIPQDYIISLNSISISTLRGIMFTLFKGTFLHKAILPIVDPKSFVLENQAK